MGLRGGEEERSGHQRPSPKRVESSRLRLPSKPSFSRSAVQQSSSSSAHAEHTPHARRQWPALLPPMASSPVMYTLFRSHSPASATVRGIKRR